MNRGQTLSLLMLLPALAISAGCNHLPAGSVQATASRPELSRAGEAYVLRGWRGLWSKGVDSLADELRGSGVDAQVFRADQARELAAALSTRFSGSGRQGPLVLIGFSYGADDAIEIAEQLGRSAIKVDLLVTLDPVTPPDVPRNVMLCRNYYQSNGPWDVFPWLRGIPLQPAESSTGVSPVTSPSRVVNINIRDRADLLEPGTSHATIAANPRLHAAILADVLLVCPPRHASGR